MNDTDRMNYRAMDAAQIVAEIERLVSSTRPDPEKPAKLICLRSEFTLKANR